MSEVIQLAASAGHMAPGTVEVTPAVRTNVVYVLFTTIDDTLAAVRVAAILGKTLAAPLTVVHFRRIPYALPVDGPAGVSPAESEAFIDRLRSEGIDARVRVYLCRSERRAVPMAFKRHSLVVVGGRHSWWPTSSERVRRQLEKAGHFVVFVDGDVHRVLST